MIAYLIAAGIVTLVIVAATMMKGHESCQSTKRHDE